MSPTRSKGSALGTNPLSLGAPAESGDSFVLDMATTSVAVGKIEIQRRKNQPIPHGWAQDTEGNMTTDATLAYNSGCLMPLGGPEITSGFKGSGLGLMVETVCGILAGKCKNCSKKLVKLLVTTLYMVGSGSKVEDTWLDLNRKWRVPISMT